MNQILSMNQENPDFGSNYNNYNNNNNNGGGKGPMDLKTVKRIFSVMLIIFGLVLFVSGIIGLVSGEKAPADVWPKVYTEQHENVLTLMLSSDVAIDVIEYAWNNGNPIEIPGDGTTDITREILVPEGNNVLNLTVTDVAGKVKTYSDSFYAEAVEDKTPPTIELVVSGAKLNITAKTTTQTKIKYMVYKWNNEPETKIDATGDQNMIEAKTDVPAGENTLTVIAVKENGVEAKQERKFDGKKKPAIEATKDKEYVVVKMSHEKGIKDAKITFNDKAVVLTPDHFGKPVVEFKLRLKDGQNRIKIEAISMDDTTEVYDGVATKE